MNESRFEKLAPLTGALFFVLLLLGSFLFPVNTYQPPAQDVVEALSANSTQAQIGAYLGVVSAFFLIWFSGSVYSALRDQEGGTGRLSTVAFGGGVASGLVVAAGFGVMLAAAGRAGTAEGISAQGAITLYDFRGQLLGTVLPVMLGVLIGATAMVSLRAAVFPTWFGWLSVITTIGLLSPISYIFVIFGGIWVLVISIWLYIRGATGARQAATGETATGTA